MLKLTLLSPEPVCLLYIIHTISSMANIFSFYYLSFTGAYGMFCFYWMQFLNFHIVTLGFQIL